jgi:hypothetical protein
MSQQGCKCGGVPLNSGTSGCIEQIKTWDYLVRVDQQDDQGVANFIPAGTVIDQAYVQGKLNETDPSKKWTIFPKLWTVEDVRADALTETIDNIDFIERQGTRTFNAMFIGKFASPQMEATWKSFSCRSNAVFGLTSGGQIEGNNPNLAGDLYPIKVQNDTWFAIYQKPTKAPTKQKIMISFAVDETEEDACLDFIAADSIAYATTNWYLDAPIDVEGFEVSNATQTTITFKMKERFGSVKKNDIPGLVSADFSDDNGATPDVVFNKTTSAQVAIIGVTTATVAGELEYTITFVAQTAADVISIDIFKLGLDMRTPLEVTLS